MGGLGRCLEIWGVDFFLTLKFYSDPGGGITFFRLQFSSFSLLPILGYCIFKHAGFGYINILRWCWSSFVITREQELTYFHSHEWGVPPTPSPDHSPAIINNHSLDSPDESSLRCTTTTSTHIQVSASIISNNIVMEAKVLLICHSHLTTTNKGNHTFIKHITWMYESISLLFD